MLKWVVIIFLILALGVCVLGYFSNVHLRNGAIINGEAALLAAAQDYSEHGYVTNYGARSYQVWLFTNEVSIGGTQYECFIRTTNVGFYNSGALEMTTNKVFIWLDWNGPPKIIGTNYRAPIFPPRF
jgi:hypothetical protein